MSEPKALNSDIVRDFRETRGATRSGLKGTPMLAPVCSRIEVGVKIQTVVTAQKHRGGAPV